MELRVYDQLRQILAALITGGAAGLLYDSADCLAPGNGIWNKLLRIWAVLASAVFVFAVGRASGAGQRLFFLLAAAGGVCLYHGALHAMLRKDLENVKHFLQYYAQYAYRSAVRYRKKQ